MASLRLRRSARVLTMLFAAIQFATPALVSVVDGAVSRDARDVRTHVEELGRNACTPSHAADCATCRYLNGPPGVLPASAAVPVPTGAEIAPSSVLASHIGASRNACNSRAPPTLLG